MILIADSGSTKTDWVLWNKHNNQSSNHQSKGLNPFFVDSEEIAETLKSTFTEDELYQVENIYFYGSGCGSQSSQKIVSDGLTLACPKAITEVSHDLLAAARALCGTKPGIACILGTGSNSCVYDGEKVIEEGVSFGYILGDEGSGNHLGRKLLKAIFTKKAPEHIIEAFKLSYPHLDLSKLLQHLYQLASPSKFLAGFSPFVKAHHHDAFMRDLIEESFAEFFEFFIFDFYKKYKYPVHFMGSIAWNYKPELINSLTKYEINHENVIHNPIQHLFEYHQDQHHSLDNDK